MHSALSVVADAVFKVLNVPSLTAPPPIGFGLGNRIFDNPVIPAGEDQTFPLIWYELAAERMMGGLGPGPWLLEVDIRVHVFSQAKGMAEVQDINERVVGLLRAASNFPVAGWSSWYQPHDAVIALPFELLNTVPVRELVAENRLYLEEAA